MDSRDTCKDIEQSTVSNRVYLDTLYLFVVLLIATGCREKPNENRTREKPTESTILLCQAAEEGDIEQVQKLIAAGADVNAKNSYGRSSLHEAAFQGHEDVVELLLANGADINLRSIGMARHHFTVQPGVAIKM